MDALEVSQLCKRYGPGCERCFASTGAERKTNICGTCGTIVALNDVSLTLPQGEIVGIMGESGSGKSTLLRCLFFEDTPERGSAVFSTASESWSLFDLNAAEARSLRDRMFSVVHQNPRLGLNFDVSAGGNIAERILTSGRRHYGYVRNRASELLDRTCVPTGRIDELPGSFSGGMQQRVQIAKALSVQPAILFLDEVTSGLDLSVQARILDLIQELHRQLQLSLLVVTHDIGVVKLLASHALIMQHGQIVERGLTDRVLEDPQHAYTQELIGAAL